MGGISFGGLFVSILRIITTTGSPDDAVPLASGGCSEEPSIDWSTFMYFSLSSFVLLSNVFGYLMLKRLPITKYYESQGSKMVRPVLLADSAATVSLKQKYIKLHEPEDDESSFSAAVRVLKIVKLPAFSSFFVFVVTYSLYPGLTTLITSEGTNAKFFAPAMFLLFNLGDLAGRLSCGFIDVHSTGFKLSKKVVRGVLVRLVFIPAFMLCNVSGSVLPDVFQHDAWPFLFMTLFSYTNGLLVTLSMMIAPTLVHFEDKKAVGSMMTFLLSTGVLAGSCASFLSVGAATGT
jgi:equilibrative nucleoside transporter 1/2/3